MVQERSKRQCEQLYLPMNAHPLLLPSSSCSVLLCHRSCSPVLSLYAVLLVSVCHCWILVLHPYPSIHHHHRSPSSDNCIQQDTLSSTFTGIGSLTSSTLRSSNFKSCVFSIINPHPHHPCIPTFAHLHTTSRIPPYLQTN